MNDSQPEAITFPANPFVALADFIMVLVTILILAIVHQSLSSSSLLERAAVANDQKIMNDQIIARTGKDSGLRETHVDGDLQRFRIEGRLSFRRDSAELLPSGDKLLRAFGDEIARHRGKEFDDNSRPFKRIIVEGHADTASEADAPDGLWGLSMRRAQAAVQVLEKKCHIYPRLLEASGRGDSIALHRPPGQSASETSESNRRLELIIIYSGKVSMTYQSGQESQPSH